MEPAEYDKMFEVDESHFWYRGRRAVVFNQVPEIEGWPQRVLDLGCGTGSTMAHMPTGWTAIGADSSDQALRLAQRRGLQRVLRADAQRLPFRDAEFDLIFCLDVLEHCEDDGAAARELARVLRPGGRLVVTVPAYGLLFGPHDVALHHHRRYRRSAVVRLLGRAGLTIERSSYFNTLLFIPAALSRLAAKRWATHRTRSDVEMGPKVLNTLLTGLFSLELPLLRRMRLPFGLSVLCVCRRA